MKEVLVTVVDIDENGEGNVVQCKQGDGPVFPINVSIEDARMLTPNNTYKLQFLPMGTPPPPPVQPGEQPEVTE